MLRGESVGGPVGAYEWACVDVARVDGFHHRAFELQLLAVLVHEGGATFMGLRDCASRVEGAGARLEASAAVPEEVAFGQLGFEVFMFKGTVSKCRGDESQQYKRWETHGAIMETVTSE